MLSPLSRLLHLYSNFVAGCSFRIRQNFPPAPFSLFRLLWNAARRETD
jgi:hypothetical protein